MWQRAMFPFFIHSLGEAAGTSPVNGTALNEWPFVSERPDKVATSSFMFWSFPHIRLTFPACSIRGKVTVSSFPAVAESESEQANK